MSEADQISSCGDLFKILYLVTGKCFLFLMLYFMLDGLILFCKGNFVV